MTALHYLFAAFVFIWAGILFYMVRVSSMRGQLESRIRRIEDRFVEKEQSQ